MPKGDETESMQGREGKHPRLRVMAAHLQARPCRHPEEKAAIVAATDEDILMKRVPGRTINGALGSREIAELPQHPGVPDLDRNTSLVSRVELEST